MPELLILALLVAWVGHACIWTSALNYVYGRRLPKVVLKPWRLVTGVVIVAFPALTFAADVLPVTVYFVVCLVFGGGVFPAITLARLFHKPPSAVISEQ